VLPKPKLIEPVRNPLHGSTGYAVVSRRRSSGRGDGTLSQYRRDGHALIAVTPSSVARQLSKFTTKQPLTRPEQLGCGGALNLQQAALREQLERVKSIHHLRHRLAARRRVGIAAEIARAQCALAERALDGADDGLCRLLLAEMLQHHRA